MAGGGNGGGGGGNGGDGEERRSGTAPLQAAATLAWQAAAGVVPRPYCPTGGRAGKGEVRRRCRDGGSSRVGCMAV